MATTENSSHLSEPLICKKGNAARKGEPLHVGLGGSISNFRSSEASASRDNGQTTSAKRHSGSIQGPWNKSKFKGLIASESCILGSRMMAKQRSNAQTEFAGQAEQTAEIGRRIQSKVDERDAAKGTKANQQKSMQAGVRPYPAPPLPPQHLAKPGLESALTLQPMF